MLEYKYNLVTVFSVLFFSAILFFAFSNPASASTLSCFQVDGMAIFGYKYGDWEFIGAIANEFDSDSIANEFGAGNEFSSDSIFNEFGSFGSEFSSYSAFNEFASKPPIIVNDNYKFVGYLTINEFKTPNINTYEAIACARNSFRSFSNSDLEDTVFKDIPSGGGYSGGSTGYSQQDIEELLKSACPANSSYTGSGCTCNTGYVANASGDACITITQSCQSKYGVNSYGSGTSCYCAQGYEWNSSQTSCVPSVTCSANSTKIGGSCVCNDGFVMRNGQCISYTADCKLIYGENIIGTKGPNSNSLCDCASGYVWNSGQTACIKKVVASPPTPTQVEPSKSIAESQILSAEKTAEQDEVTEDTSTDTNIQKQEEVEIIADDKMQDTSEREGIFKRIWSWFISLF